MLGSHPVDKGANDDSAVDRDEMRWIVRKGSDVVARAVRNVSACLWSINI